MNIKKINNNIIIFTGMSILFILCISANINIFKNNLFEMSTFFIIAFICIIRISFFEKYTYSLDSFHFLFIYLFTVIAPLYQIGSGEFPWDLSVSNQPIYKANLLIIIWMLIYMISYKFIKDKKGNLKVKFVKYNKNNNRYFNVNCKRANVIIILISLISLLVLIREYGFANLFSRSLSNSVMQNNLKSTGLIISVFVRSLPIACFAVLIFKIKMLGHKNYISAIITFILLVVSNFPTGTARYWMGVVYLGSIILIFNKLFEKYRLIEMIGIFGMIIIFPVINIFRYITLSEFSFSDLNFTRIADMSIFLSGDFDAYSMFLRTIRVVDLTGSVYFYELLGSILFFVPRAFWVMKPEGSGPYIAKMEGLTFTNLSEPIFAEGYLNLGIIGFIIFSIFLGMILAYIDKSYWKDYKNKVLNVLTIFYPFLLGNIFTNFRGSLMVTLAYTIGQMLAFFTIYHIYIYSCKIKIIKK